MVEMPQAGVLRQDGLDELEFRRNIAHLAHSGRNVTSKGL